MKFVIYFICRREREVLMLKITNLILLIVFVSFLFAQTRHPAVAGQFYPSKKEKLQKLLENLFKQVDMKESLDLNPFGLISPHAGLTCSGGTAAYGYSLLEEKHYDTVILLGPSHNFFKDVVSIYNGNFCETPLGFIPIDKEISHKLISANKRFVFDEQIHEPEHSLEVQLPFLQHTLKDYNVVLIVISTNDLGLLEKLADTLISITEESDKKLLFINSTDFSHYHDYEAANKMDNYTIDLILGKKWDKLNMEILTRKCEMCGYFAFYPFIKIMQHFEHDDGILLQYLNSGDVIGSKWRVVGYGSIVFPNTPQNKEKQTMNELDKKYLLNLARKSIEYYFEKHKPFTPDKPENPELSEDRAVFVTLNKNGKLRGCIGHMHAKMPLYKAVVEMAVSAAFQDHRFPKVEKDELEDITIEISILSPMQRIYDPEKIRMGIDGVWIKKGFKKGVYLPQVATDTGWDRKTFLESLCTHKAGLSKDAYLDPKTEIYI